MKSLFHDIASLGALMSFAAMVAVWADILGRAG